MIILIYGTDNYQIYQRLREIKGQHSKNALNIIELPEDSNWTRLEQEVNVLPFLSNEKLIIINCFSKNKDTNIVKSLNSLLDTLPNKVDLVFIENELKPQNWLIKIINKK